ncbi:hypothetical protein, variant [Verruconis gallopava]|uniref:RBR-type E3 ubiquitin transferase n=1 Tax=Verruconis gallopava TaxID=253628 RepID=A0A0D2AI42_9PEZI|nr:hypothetical protein, variant [Verruconis gallopava]KIV98578.1 hypothetical protein, variant [Verruconis gallopava]
MDDGADEREEELSSLTAIFPEIQIDANDKYTFTIDIPVTPADKVVVKFDPRDSGIQISHLPSLKVKMTLPEGYPSQRAPVVQLGCNPPWLPRDKLDELCNEASVLWNQYGQSQMAFDYIDSLQQAAERAFDLTSGNGHTLDLDPSMRKDIIQANQEAAKMSFNAETFDCGVCLDPKKGKDCHKLHKCGHVFCIDCLRSAYDAAIAEGDVSRVKCLFPDCGVERDATTKRATKAAPTLGPDELLEIPIALAAVERYVKLKRKKRFESFPKTVYCPRKWCQGIARSTRYPKKDVTTMTAADLEPENILSEKDAEPKDLKNNEDRLRICEDCDLAFCRVCLATWHGDYVLRCWPRTADELTEEEKASYSYLLKHTSPCPSCDFAIQKSMGCNHITCFNCRSHFCYLCSAWLDPGNPYEHFNKKGTPCYQRLWDMEGGDDADGNVQFLGVRGAEMAAAAFAEEQHAENPLEGRVEVVAAQQAVQNLNLNEGAALAAAADAVPEVNPEAWEADVDDWDDWEPQPAHWRNNAFEARPAGQPRQQRLPTLGDRFRGHREGPGRGQVRNVVRNRRAIARHAAEDVRDGAEFEQLEPGVEHEN